MNEVVYLLFMSQIHTMAAGVTLNIESPSAAAWNPESIIMFITSAHLTSALALSDRWHHHHVCVGEELLFSLAEPVTPPCEALRTSTFAGVTWLSLHLRWRRSVFLSPHSLHWLTTLKIKNTNFHIFALLMFLGFFWWGKQITMNQLIHSIDLMNDHSSQKDE